MFKPVITYLAAGCSEARARLLRTSSQGTDGIAYASGVAEPAADRRVKYGRNRVASAYLALLASCVLLVGLAGKAQAVCMCGPSGTPPSRLASGDKLYDGQSLRSPNGQYTLTMQDDGNLVEKTQGRVIWAAMTQKAGPGSYAYMQPDGNFVVYNAAGQWQQGSGTNGRGVPTWTQQYPGSTLALQNDGNLVVYTTSGNPVWATYQYNNHLMAGETLPGGWSLYSPNHRYRLDMQASDGNLVEYDVATNKPVWATYKYGQYNRVVMQTDGNLVVYNPSNQWLWASWTNGDAGAYLELENDGSMFVRYNGHLAWGANRAWGQTLSYNPGGSGQCTYWAEYEFYANTGVYANTFGPNNGNAMYWAQNAQAHGWTVTTTPQVDSIVVFQPGVDGASSVGHVAWVTAVNGSQITVSEMNVRGWGVVDTTTYTVTSGMSFILAP